MTAATYFATSYAEARKKFLGACGDHGTGVAESACPAQETARVAHNSIRAFESSHPRRPGQTRRLSRGAPWGLTIRVLPTLVMVLVFLAGSSVQAENPPGQSGTQPAWVDQIKEIVSIETWRESGGANEAQVRGNIETIKQTFKGWIDDFVKTSGLRNHRPTFFEWKSPDKKYWVFGWRAGKGERKITFLTHLDTVAPGEGDWGAFEPREEERIYRGSATTFLVGRGTIDDKGPAVVTLNVLLGVLKKLDGNAGALDEVTFELLFDTSEETDLSTPHYYAANRAALPSLGIVFDASWCIRAEKGIERPVFSVPMTDTPKQGIWIGDFRTASGPTNQIPGSATARITGVAQDSLDEFAANVEQWYRGFQFDDPSYQSASLLLTRDGDDMLLATSVAGAQHGSAPEENREKGANPLVSLANFLAHLADRGVLEENHFTRISRFIRWGWGTMVFGEKHPDLLYRYDTVFKEGNGTTYALTQLVPDDGKRHVTLAVDIRYAIGHHANGWDGSEGMIPGGSLFESALTQLVERYGRTAGGIQVTVETATLAAPDIRNPRNPFLTAVNNAYREVIGVSCPMRAIGGGTDAKGNPELVAAGALFTNSLGPPINFHGVNEGAPIIDLENSAKVLQRILENELDLK